MPQTLKSLAQPLLDNGYEPLPISRGAKSPDLVNWTAIEINADRVQSWVDRLRGGDDVGIRCGRVVAVDIDVDNAEVTQALVSDAQFSLGDGPERSGKPGRAMLVFRTSSLWPKKSVKILDPDGEMHEVEVLAHGQQFVAYGRHHSGRDYAWSNGSPVETPASELPEVSESEVVEWLHGIGDLLPDGWRVVDANAMDEDERFLIRYRPPRDESEMGAEEALAYRALQSLPVWVPEMLSGAKDYKDGYRVSSKALGRDLEEDLQLTPAGIYDFGEERAMSPLSVVSRWQTDGDMQAAFEWLSERLGFDPDTHRKAAAEKRDEERPVTLWTQRIEESDSADRLQRVAAAIGRNKQLSNIDRELLANTWQAQFKGVSGHRLGIAEVRKAMAPHRAASVVEEESMPTWCAGWYYITHNDQFYRYGSSQWVSTQGFNALFQREIAPDEDGRRPSANRVALDDYRLPVVEVGIYAPHLSERFNLSGRECVNTFMPDSMPGVGLPPGEEGQRAVGLINRHIWNICGRRPAVYQGLLDWLAWCVQNPGLKVRHSPIIKGIEGDGKTVLLTLMATCLGQANVRSVTPQVVMSQFNGYAEGVCAVGLEEVRMTGHNRYDAMNALKPLITNDTVDIHKKGQDSYNALNTVNYLAFTNHGDALPVGATDRRWFVVFTPWASKAGMEEAFGASAETYFDDLHGALEHHPDALRYWLQNHQVSSKFNPNGAAPSTPEKTAMSQADMDDADEVVQELIRAGGPGYNQHIVSTRHITAAMTGEEFGNRPTGFEVPKGRALAKILQKLGYTRASRVKWDGEACRVWVRGLPLDDVEVLRKSLDETKWVTPAIGQDDDGDTQAIPF